MHWTAHAGTPLQGVLTIPGDKSVSHRSVMFAALADGISTIDGFLEGEDTRATAAIFERLGVRNRTQASVVLRELELSDPSRLVPPMES